MAWNEASKGASQLLEHDMYMSAGQLVPLPLTCCPHWPAFLHKHIGSPFKAGGPGTKTLTWEGVADSGRHAMASKKKLAARKRLADRAICPPVFLLAAVSQFLFFQPAFLPATTWQPHEQISSHSMRWRSRDGCTQNMSGPKTSMNHETYGGCWWSKVWRPLGLQWVAVKHGTFFAKNVGYLTKFWTPDSQNLTPGLKKSSFGAGFLPSTVCPLVCISYKPPGIAGTTLLIAGAALMMPKCDRWIPQRFWRPWTRPMCHDKRWWGLIFHMLLVGTQGMTIPHIIGCLFHALLRRFVLSGSCLGGEKKQKHVIPRVGPSRRTLNVGQRIQGRWDSK